jgi:hypothetical protein
MSHRGLLHDVVAAAWAALTPEERICWHFTAADNPITLPDGSIYTLNGWQFFVDTQSALAVVDPTHTTTDPQPNGPSADTKQLDPVLWPLPSKLAGGSSTKRPPVNTVWKAGTPQNTDVIITQGYNKFVGFVAAYPLTQRISAVFADSQTWLTTGTTGEYLTTGVDTAQREDAAKKNKKPAVRHVSTWQTGDGNEISLDVPTGYYATTAGENRFARIKGLTARRRPDLPLGRVKFIDRTSGKQTSATIPNPSGGAPSQISRPRHQP